MKLILAAILAGSFLVSLPAKADDKPAGDAKADKGKDKKTDKKADKGAKADDKGASKPAGGGW